MSNELIKKAYKHFNGVWPFRDIENMVVSTHQNTSWGEGVYHPCNKSERAFYNIMGNEKCWLWVGTKADFDAYGESLKEEWTPEVGQECEILCDYSLCGNFPIALKEGDKVVIQGIVDLGFGGVALVSDKGIKGTGTIIFSQLRPLKTESEKQADEMFDIVKDATDTYHACELLVKNGYKKCAG